MTLLRGVRVWLTPFCLGSSFHDRLLGNRHPSCVLNYWSHLCYCVPVLTGELLLEPRETNSTRHVHQSNGSVHRECSDSHLLRCRGPASTSPEAHEAQSVVEKENRDLCSHPGRFRGNSMLDRSHHLRTEVLQEQHEHHLRLSRSGTVEPYRSVPQHGLLLDASDARIDAKDSAVL